jgi:cytochrome c oxidase subunit 4
MEEMKSKEMLTMNGLLALLSVGCLGIVGWSVLNEGIRSGVDSLFMIVVFLMLALLFAINPMIYAFQRGWVTNPFVEDEGTVIAEVDEHHGGSNRENIVIWVALLALTAAEVYLAYKHIDPTLMLIIVMVLSIIKAGLIIAYFMHMKFEQMTFILTVVPILVVLLCLFGIFFPDGKRVHDSHPKEQIEAAAPHQ